MVALITSSYMCLAILALATSGVAPVALLTCAFSRLRAIRRSISSMTEKREGEGASNESSQPQILLDDQKRRAFISSTTLLLIGIVAGIAWVFLLWLIVSFSSESKGSTAVYETRSILGYAETVAVASVAVFLPLLIILWNGSQEAVSGTLEKLIVLCGKQSSSGAFLSEQVRQIFSFESGDSPENRLRRAIIIASNDFDYLKKVASELRPPFFRVLCFIGVYFCLLAIANFLPGQGAWIYFVAAAFKGIALVIFLWLLRLLCIYLILVQPVVRETKYAEIFGVEGLIKGEK